MDFIRAELFLEHYPLFLVSSEPTPSTSSSSLLPARLFSLFIRTLSSLTSPATPPWAGKSISFFWADPDVRKSSKATQKLLEDPRLIAAIDKIRSTTSQGSSSRCSRNTPNTPTIRQLQALRLRARRLHPPNYYSIHRPVRLHQTNLYMLLPLQVLTHKVHRPRFRLRDLGLYARCICRGSESAPT